jgi:hypothetical protein
VRAQACTPGVKRRGMGVMIYVSERIMFRVTPTPAISVSITSPCFRN